MYTPDHNFFGTDIFTYAIGSRDGYRDRATVTVVVNGFDDSPHVLKVEVGNSAGMYEIETGRDNVQLFPIDIDGGINQIAITFDRPVDNDNPDIVRNVLAVYGRTSGGWGPAKDVSFNGDSTQVTWTFGDGPYKGGEMILRLSDAITADGIAMDGDWTSPDNFDDNSGNSTFDGGRWSGDGTTGGDFYFNFTLPNTLGGDADCSGVVDAADAAIVSANWMQTGMAWTQGDFNGDEFVNDYDATIMTANWDQTVWSSVAPMPSAPLACDMHFEMDVDGVLDGRLLGYLQGRPGDITYQWVGGPSHGSLEGGVVNADGSFTYTPTGGYSGVDTFTFMVFDGVEDSGLATATIYVGVTPPKVVGVRVGNSSTAEEETIETAANSNIQLMPVPIYDGIDQVIIEFDQPVSAEQADLTLNGQAATGFAVAGTTCTWTFAGPDDGKFKLGPMKIELSDNVNIDGLVMDGEWASPEHFDDNEANSTFAGGLTSGNGRHGGDFEFTFSMLLPGDADCSGVVDEIDSAIVASHWLQSGMTWGEGDFSGDGHVNEIDATIMAANWGRKVWETVAFDAGFDAATNGSVSDNLSGLDRLLGENVTYQRILGCSHGSATVNADGSFSYAPSAGYYGIDTFTFRTFDGVDYSDPATVTVYVGAPVVSNVVVQNSSTYAWRYIETAADGDDQLMPVPIYDGIDLVWIAFDRPVTATASDLTLNGDGADTFTSYGSWGCWTFSTEGPFKFGPMVLELSDAVNANGVPLDGEWTSPEYFDDNTDNSTFDGGLTSGDGQRGGDFNFNFSMLLPGDANCDGVVNLTDLGRVGDNWGSGPDATWDEGDFNGDGYVDGTDLGILASNWGLTVWPQPEGMMAMGGGWLGGESLLAADSSLTISSALDAVFEQYGYDRKDAADQPVVGSDDWDDLLDDIFDVFDRFEPEAADLYADDYISPHKTSTEPFGSFLEQFELVAN